MANYLVTGGAGFIGTHLVERLLSLKHTVTVIDNLETGQKQPCHAKTTFLKADISDDLLLEEIMPSMDACFHLAAIASVAKTQQDWIGTHKTNLTGTLKIFSAAKLKKTPVIYASSAAIYGNNASLPLSESALPSPRSIYAADKLGCEYLAKVVGLAAEIPTIGLRFFNVYGPGQCTHSPYSGVISIFTEKMLAHAAIPIFGDGIQTRDFIYIDDVVDGLLLALTQVSTTAPCYNICTGKQTSLIALHVLFETLTQQQIPLNFLPPREEDVMHSCGCPQNAAKNLGFMAKVPLQAGLEKLLKTL